MKQFLIACAAALAALFIYHYGCEAVEGFNAGYEYSKAHAATNAPALTNAPANAAAGH